MAPPSAVQSVSKLKRNALTADRMVMAVLVLGALGAVGLGLVNGPIVSGTGIAIALTVVGAIIWRIAPGTRLSSIGLAVVGMLMVALHIQLAMGLTELHFGVFVFLAFLLVYRDWRPILAAAATIAVHHVLFDRLQAVGWPVYCMSEPNFGRVLLHATFVVVQTTVEILIALRMGADSRAAQELHDLCRPTADGQLNLDVRAVQVQSASALEVRNAFLQLEDVVQQARMTANVVLQSSTHIAQSNTDLEQRAHHTLEQLQETTQSVQHIQNDAQTCAAESASARQLADLATQDAQQCGHLVAQVIGAMNAINESSRKIGDIVSLIDSIAFQTNILALNAAVEAARAGEHGNGFAVVANEVRQLAQRSASAAKDVRNLIQNSLAHAKDGVDLVDAAGNSMHSVVQRTESMAQVIDQLNRLSQQQAQALAQAAQTVQVLDRSTQETAQLIEQSSQSATHLLEQAQKLQTVVAGVKSGHDELTTPTPASAIELATDVDANRDARSLSPLTSSPVHA